MSESSGPPPLPSFVQPVPVQVLSPEYPFADKYIQFRRPPGIITATGIISIVVGSLGLMTGGLSVLYGCIFYFVVARRIAMMNAALIAPPPVVRTQTINLNPAPAVDPGGLDPAARQIVIAVLAEQRPLNEARRKQLHALLARAGRDMFANDGEEINPARVRSAITESGQLPRTSDSQANDGPDYFVIATGRIEVSDDRALFQPSDRSEETIRVSAALPADDSGIGSVAVSAPSSAAPNGGISAMDVQMAMSIIAGQVGHNLTPQQRRTLSAEFSSNAGLLRLPPPGMSIQSELIASNIHPDGTLMVLTRYGNVRVTPAGVVLSRIVYSNANASRGMAVPFNRGFWQPRVSGAATILVVAEGAASFLLSIYLIVIGIFMLRQSRQGRRLHLIYALVKIPLAILCGFGWCWIAGGMNPAAPASGGIPQIQVVRASILAFLTGVAIIYPISLLIVLFTKSVNRYYADASV